MPKNPDSGATTPPDNVPGADSGAQQPGERRAGARGAGAVPVSGNGGAALNPAGADDLPPAAGPAPGQPAAARTIGERKKQFVIAPRQQAALGLMSLSPLSLSTVEEALRTSPDIEIIDTIGPRGAVGAMAAGMGGAMGMSGGGAIVARMTDQKAGALHLQAAGRLLVERDQYLGLMDPQLQPHFVTSVVPTSGPAFSATITVLGKDGAPVADAEVSLFGSMLPASASTDANGQATLTLFGESAGSIRSLYVKPKADYWSFYQRDPDVSADEPNLVMLRALSDWPTMAGFPRQQIVGWGQKAMRMEQLPPHFRGQGIRIAVIDSGAATSHDALKRIRAGFDIVHKRSSPQTWNEDALGHGSHCAGVIGGADLASGIRGFAPEAELHVCKLFPGGQVSQLIDALEYCIEQQIDVVNLSLGGAEPSEALEQQIQRARRAGVACIVAAGNSGGPVQYPASSPNVLAVAAIGKLDEFPPDSYHAQTLTNNVDANGYFSASFSCHGAQIGVCGPGVAITSTVPPNNYAAWDGTSMAAPHITGLAALVLAHHPDFQGMFKMRSGERVERLFNVLRSSARRVTLGSRAQTGLGLPDALIALGLQPLAGQSGSALAGVHGPIGSFMQQAGTMGLIGGIMAPQQAYGQLGGAPGSLDPYAVDPGAAAYAAYLNAYPFAPGGPGFQRGGW